MATDDRPTPPASAEDLASLPEFHHPVVSPDGEQVALYYDESGRNELYLLDRGSGERRRVSDGDVPRNARWHLLWGGAGERVYYHRDEDGDEQNDVAAITPAGEVEVVVDVDGQGILADTSTDGRALLYTSDEGEQMNLYRYDRESGERERLTDYDQPVLYAVFGPDDERIAYVANESEQLENRDVYVMDADGGNVRRLDVGEVGAASVLFEWFPDGDRLLVSDDSEDLRRVGVYDLATDAVEWLGPHEAEEAPAALTPDGRYVVVGRQRRGATMPAVYDLETGEGRELAVPEGVASFPMGPGSAVVDETTVVFAHSRPDERQALLEYDLSTDETRVLLAADDGDVDADAFVDARYVTYRTEGVEELASDARNTPPDDGTEIGGLLYDPRDGPARADDATDVPGVVVVHGGPHSRSTKAFDLYAQFLVSRGYAVFQPNYRGSTGRGRAFKQAIIGDWGGLEQADVAAGGRWLAERDWVDAERVAVFGGSYGGYSTYMQLVQYPELWATGVAWIGITDLLALYEESMPHFQHALREMLGDPEENEDLWRERSAVTHLDEQTSPVFVIHGVNDPRCPVSQARRYRDALEERGWEVGEDFEYEELTDEGHGSSDIGQKIRAFELLGDYLDRRL